ncbi:MaoC family dehydratase [Octadecabacter sp.]|nr:MaoC family dehydratase [Octadecabacter sp.]MDC1380082.1 MaoC family dehydratase [Octadecabacter sp.]MDC1397876.1 MaoC family dehydratase [Octadecabacter sp.]
MTKTNAGHFLEDYTIGQTFRHGPLRTVGAGERALYQALYPTRFGLSVSDPLAQFLGLPRAPLDDMIVFHKVFGATVPDISLNAVANLGYADIRWLRPVYPDDSLGAVTEVIGLKQNSNSKTGIVWVRTVGINAAGEDVLSFVRWVMVRKRDVDAPSPTTVVPDLPDHVPAAELAVPQGLDFSDYSLSEARAPHRLGDYEVGEIIDHIDGVTLEEAEHMMATRLWQNTAKVHFDVTARPEGKRLIYGGHIISLARALSFNGLEGAELMVAINAGAHANPAFAGDTVRAWSEVLDTAETKSPGVGAIRLRLVATKGGDVGALKGEGGKYLPDVLLDLDYWALMPT